MKATIKRTIVKSLLYRLFVILTTYIMLLITGQNMTQAIIPTIIINCLWTLSYFVNERIWNSIDWGKV
jgi:uncharacterized membrane protein